MTWEGGNGRQGYGMEGKGGSRSGPAEAEAVKVGRAPAAVNAVVAFSVVSPEIKQAIESVKYIAENMRSRNKAKEVRPYTCSHTHTHIHTQTSTHTPHKHTQTSKSHSCYPPHLC